ncbi:MAG: porin [Pseudomonadota bacterium]
MNKKLIAVAVAGLFAAPSVALAQSSVTISGFFKGGYEATKYSGRAGNNSQWAVVDDSSRIIFNVVEDLGRGLHAIGQYDQRMSLDMGNLVGTGNNHVGLRSNAWGRIFFGRQDLHYFGRESEMTTRGSLRSDSISLLAFAGGGATAIAGATRTANVIHYTTPNWGGFTVIGAYSSNAKGADADIGSGTRKGRALNFAPTFQRGPFVGGYSYWRGKDDAGGNTLATGDQRGDRLFGSYKFGGFKIGLAFDKSKIKGATNGASLSSRRVWSFPASYSWGNHSIHGHFDKASNDRATAGDDSAKMIALSYAYDLSKRTSAALTYAIINNRPAGVYNLFTANGLGGGVATLPGEDPRVWALTLRHQF